MLKLAIAAAMSSTVHSCGVAVGGNTFPPEAWAHGAAEIMAASPAATRISDASALPMSRLVAVILFISTLSFCWPAFLPAGWFCLSRPHPHGLGAVGSPIPDRLPGRHYASAAINLEVFLKAARNKHALRLRAV